MQILCGEDQPLLALGLERALAVGGIELLAVVGERGALLAAAADCRPDVVLVSHRMLRPDAVAAVGALSACAEAVLVLAEHERLRSTLPLVAAGARGIVRAEADAAELLAAIARAVAGELVLEPTMQRFLVEDGRQPRLSARETEVLVLVARGATNPEIAAALYLAIGTVKVHLQRIFTKLGVSDRGAAAMRAVRLGLLDPDLVEVAAA